MSAGVIGEQLEVHKSVRTADHGVCKLYVVAYWSAGCAVNILTL